MKTKLTLFALLLSFMSIWSQERFAVNAPNGLNVRGIASANSTKVGKLPYRALVTIVEKTNISYEVNEDGETFQSQWVKIKYDNFPYINANEPSYEWNRTGYVVNYYLEKLNKKYLVSKIIDSTAFYNLYKEPIPYNPLKITSFEEVKKMLSNKVKWSASPQFEESEVVDEIYLSNGQTLDIDEEVIDYSFMAYYPSEEILVFEGGHGSEFSISLKTGKTLETVGNPEYIVNAPDSKFRLNGWFPGQECVTYFFQERIGDTYIYLTEFENNVCYFTKFCWLTDGDFLYSYKDYTENEKGEEKYIRGSLIKNEEDTTIRPSVTSSLRPNEALKLGTEYTDTVDYVAFNDVDYDDRLFSVEKNNSSTILIFNRDLNSQLVKGDRLEITWKIECYRPAGDPESIQYREHLVSYALVSSFKLKDKNVKALWRETKYDETQKAKVNTMLLNKDYMRTISGAERAALAYVATFIGNECEWEGKANESRSNLTCKILSSLDLGYQCSDRHYGFLKKWFSKDESVLKTLERCVTIPNGATKQSTFDEIVIQTNARNQTIEIFYKVMLLNMRENSVSRYVQTDTFKYDSGNLMLIDSEKIAE